MKRKFKKYFVPHEENEYHPHFLREKSVIILAAIIVLLFAISILQNTLIKQVNFASIVSSVLVDLANSDRQENSVAPLSMNPLLVEAAQNKANDMAEKEYFAHKTPEGLSPWHWLKDAGYDFVYAGENLAINFSDSQKVEDAWMNSPSHRDNILNPRFTEIGIATAKGFYNNKETIFVVQMFGSPAPILETPTLEEPVYYEEELEIVEEEETFVAVANTNYTEVLQQEAADENKVVVQGASYASLPEKMVVSPNKTLFYFYLILGTLVVFSLIFFIFIEIKKHHLKSVAYALFLIIFMIGLFYFNHVLLIPDVLVK